MSHETEGTDNRVFAYSDVRHDNTVAASCVLQSPCFPLSNPLALMKNIRSRVTSAPLATDRASCPRLL
jgi:hypothetical protein